MANTLLINTILDGTRNTIIRADITGDGSGEIGGWVLYNPPDYDNKTKTQRICKIQYNLIGFSASIWWERSAVPPSPLIAQLESDYYGLQEYEEFGNLSNAHVLGITGKIFLTTKNLSVDDRGYIILHLQHKDTKPGEM